RGIGDAAVAAREVAHLRFPVGVVGRKLVQEQDRRAAAGFLEIELHLVVGDGVRHGLRLPLFLLLRTFVMLTAAMRQGALLFVTKTARNHLRIGSPRPHLILLSSHRDFLKRSGSRLPLGRWANGGVKKDRKRINCLCLNCLMFAARLWRWPCVRRLSLRLPRRLRRGHTTLRGDWPMPARSAAITICGSSRIIAFAALRGGRAGMTTSPVCGHTVSSTPMRALVPKSSPVARRCQAARPTSSAKRGITSAAIRPAAAACGARAS